MTITAKHPGTCTKCGSGIVAGAAINWERGRGAEHVTCPAAPPVPTNLTRMEYLVGYGSVGPLYAACGDREEEFISRAAAHNAITVEEVRSRLLAGRSVPYEYVMDVGPYDIRDGAICEAAAKRRRLANDRSTARHDATHPRMRCRSCGQSGNRGSYPFSTNPASGLCDDCT